MLSEDDKWYAVSLRLCGDSLDPARVEALIGLSPTTVGLKGQKRKRKQGREYAPYETNIWVYRHEAAGNTGFEDRLRGLFSLLGSRRAALKTLCATQGIEGEMFLGFGSGSGQGGDTISTEVLALVADTGLSLSLDLYPPTVDEDENDTSPRGT